MVPPVENARMVVDVVKYPDISHYRYELQILGEDEYGLWLGSDREVPVFRGEQFLFMGTDRVVLLVPRDLDWMARWYVDHEVELYVDVTTVPLVTANQLMVVDLDLDVIRWRDGRVELVDEEEFEHHKAILKYPLHLSSRARSTATRLLNAVSSFEEPFGEASDKWLAQLIE